jgi:hypothetical protein
MKYEHLQLVSGYLVTSSDINPNACKATLILETDRLDVVDEDRLTIIGLNSDEVVHLLVQLLGMVSLTDVLISTVDDDAKDRLIDIL